MDEFDETRNRSSTKTLKKSIVVEFDFLAGRSTRNGPETIAKEVAATSAEKDPVINSWTFASPYSESELSSDAKRRNAWMLRNLHGLTWRDGRTPYYKLEENLKNVVRGYDRVFCKGLEKRVFLTKIVERETIDLNELGCPKAKEINENGPSTTRSFRHERMFDDRIYFGALQKCVLYAQWIYRNQDIVNNYLRD